MSSGTSTEARPADAGFQPWQFFLLLSMAAATAAVMMADETHPAALLLISAAVIACGLVGWAFHVAIAGFFGVGGSAAPADERTLSELEREKALALRAIKELEFDHAMGKVSDADFTDMGGRLRARAVSLMQELERPARVPAAEAASRPAAPDPAASVAGPTCAGCGTQNDADARFCKSCGARL